MILLTRPGWTVTPPPILILLCGRVVWKGVLHVVACPSEYELHVQHDDFVRNG